MNTIEAGPSNNARDSEVWSRFWTHFRVDRRSPRYCHVTFDHPGRTVAIGVSPTGLSAWIDVLVRLARAPVVSIVIADHPWTIGELIDA